MKIAKNIEKMPPKMIAGVILFSLPHLSDIVNPAKPRAEINAARLPFNPLKDNPELTMIKTPIIESNNDHLVFLRMGSFNRGQAKMAVKNGAQANMKAAFAMDVDWKA